jgi:hypothetical protein
MRYTYVAIAEFIYNYICVYTQQDATYRNKICLSNHCQVLGRTFPKICTKFYAH